MTVTGPDLVSVDQRPQDRRAQLQVRRLATGKLVARRELARAFMALTGTGAGASLAVGGPGAGELTSVTGSRARWHLRLPETPEQAAVGVRGGAYVQSATLPCALAAGSALTAAGARV